MSKLASALATIKRMGGIQVDIRQSTVTPAAESWKTSSTAVATNTVWAALTSIAHRDTEEGSYAGRIAKNIVKRGDREYLIPASGMTFVPSAGDELVDDGTQRQRIISVPTIADKGVDIVYQLQARI